jgi:hypothetical protein
MTSEWAYRGAVDLIAGSPVAIVIHCSDYRFQEAIPEFLREGLAIDSYDLFVIPGGAHFASIGDLMPKHLKVGKQSLKFLVERHQPRQLILIDHADGVFFKEEMSYFFIGHTLNERQTASLKKARGELQEWFPRMIVDAYFAEAQGHEPVHFLKIP